MLRGLAPVFLVFLILNPHVANSTVTYKLNIQEQEFDAFNTRVTETWSITLGVSDSAAAAGGAFTLSDIESLILDFTMLNPDRTALVDFDFSDNLSAGIDLANLNVNADATGNMIVDFSLSAFVPGSSSLDWSLVSGDTGFFNTGVPNWIYSIAFEDRDAASGRLILSKTFTTNGAFLRVVPEPTTLVLMGLGLAGIGLARRKKLN